MKYSKHFSQAIITKTINSNYIHSILILIEYFIFIFPFVISSKSKLVFLGDIYVPFNLEEKFRIMSRIKEYFYIKNHSILINLYFFSICMFNILCSFIYYILKAFYQKIRIGKLPEIILNFYNLFFFRYLSIFFLDNIIQGLVFEYQKKEITNGIILAFFLISLLFQIRTIYKFIQENKIYLNISNKNICQEYSNYPFDNYSSVYETNMLFLKVLCSFESNFLLINNNQIKEVNIFFNIFIISSSFYFMLREIIYNFNFRKKTNSMSLFANFYLNSLRQVIIILNFLFCLSTFFIPEKKINFLIFILCFALSSFFIVAKWFFYDKPFLLRKKRIEKDVLLFLLCNDFENNQFIKDLFYSVEIKYFSYIQRKKKEENITMIETILQVYHYQNKNDKENSKSIEDYLINYFFAKHKGNSFKAYKHLKLICLYSNNYSMLNLILFVEKIISKSHANYLNSLFDSKCFFENLINLSSINKGISNVIQMFQKILKNDRQFQNAEDFLQTAKELIKVKKQLLPIISNQQYYNIKFSSNRESNKLKDYNKKSAAVFLKYHILISRYVIESLTNSLFDDLPIINIELFEDFLSLNYQNSSFVMLSTDLSLQNIEYFEVILMSGMRKEKKKNLFQYFPKQYRKEGQEKFLKLVENHKDKSISQFEYIIKKKGYYEHFIYNFEIFDSLVNQKIILYGFYQNIYHKIIILQVEKEGTLSIINYSKSLNEIFVLNPGILKKFKKEKKSLFNLNNFFRNVSIGEHYESISCELDFNHLYDNFLLISQSILINQKELSQKILKARHFLETKRLSFLLIKMKKLFEINEKTYVYSSSLFNQKKSITLNCQTKFSFEKIANNSENEEFNYNNFLRINSSSSISGHQDTEKNSSIISTVSKLEKIIENNIIKRETILLFKSSIIRLLLNGIIFLLCFIFLYIQIIQTNELIDVNTLYFDFKNLRASFSNTFYSISSLICLGETNLSSQEKCDNNLVKYFYEFQMQVNFSDYNISEFVWFENSEKINSLKLFYEKFKQGLYSKKKYNKYTILLDTNVSFSLLMYRGNRLIQYETTQSFDESLLMMINREIELSSISSDSSYIYKSFPVINSVSNKYIFSNEFTQNFNNIRRCLFEILANFINFSGNYDKGESMLTQFFNQIKKNNIIIIISFMLIFIIFNIGLCFVNIYTLNIGNLLFKKLIANFILNTNDIKFKEYFQTKLSNLFVLNELFTKDPTKLLQSIMENTKKYKNQILLKGRKVQINEKSKENEEMKNYLFSLSNDSYEMNTFFIFLIRPLHKKNIFAFFIYLLGTISFDLLLIIQIISVFHVREYVDNSLTFTHSIYSSLSLLQLSHIINSTYSELLDENDYSDKSIVNLYIKKGMKLYDSFIKMQKIKGYQQQQDFYPNECEKIFKISNDNIFISFYNEILGIYDNNKYFEICEKFCNYFRLSQHQYFAYEDYFHRMQVLHNSHNEKSIEGIYSLFNKEYYILYIYTYFYIRPVKKNYDLYLLSPMIINKFKSYVIYVWVYLTVNLMLQVFLFGFSKFFIWKKINQVKSLFFLIAQCIKECHFHEI